MLLLLGGAGLLAWAYFNRQQVGTAAADVETAVESGVADVQAAIAGWKAVNQGPMWVPVLNAAEQQHGIPADLLARMAYQESRFRQDVIDGTTVSSAGALGLMQLMPQYFNTVTGPRPFTPTDTQAQIQQAAQQLVGLMNHFNDWALAVAAYNDGQGNIDQYIAGTRALPAETTSYVADILADVPLTGLSS